MSIKTIHSALIESTPAADGFTMPAEWSAHECTWMMWPTRAEVWQDFEATIVSFVHIAQTIRRFEPVKIAVSAQHEKLARQKLGAEFEYFVHPIDDSWARDAGPNFLLNGKGQLAASKWQFNAWGGKYHPYDSDMQAGVAIAESATSTVFRSNLTAEGGGISVDGEGTVITTRSCFPHTNRNPGWTEREIEDELKASLGAEKIIWLPGNDDETETNGHVDGIAMFVKPGVVVMETSFDPAHPWYDILQENIEVMRGQTDAKGREIDIILIEDGFGCAKFGDKFCTSYINSYIVNGAVIMPKYGIAADDRARDVFAKIYPDREIVMINIDGIAVGGGGIHCITQQQPKATS